MARYKLTDGDKAIIKRARDANDPNIFLNYYVRSEHTGTWYRPVSDADIGKLELEESRAVARNWQALYQSLIMVWEYLGKPEYFGPDKDDPEEWVILKESEFEDARERLERVYHTVIDSERTITFHYPHGALLLPWQTEAYRNKSAIQVIPGGFGSGKTFAKMLTMLYEAATLKGYKGLALAPNSDQAGEIHSLATTLLEGTLYAERFLTGSPIRPRPVLVIENSLVGMNTITCFPIMEGNKDNSKKLLTLTVDEALVDQAEQIEDLTTVIRNVGSRFRGVTQGRPRKGQIMLVANSADNQQLYDLFDESLTDPDYIYAYSPSTFENTYLTVADLIRYEKQVGKDEHSRRMYLFGERPVGNGEHFPRESITRCRSAMLDEIMAKNIELGTQGYTKSTAPHVGVHRWVTPPEKGRLYMVAADPGWGNPPNRNASAIGVFDITNFPYKPAILVAFDWVFGNGSPNPWMSSYTEFVLNYSALGMNGFDATGFQSGYERMTDMSKLLVTPVSLAGNTKYVYLNLTKKIFADGLFQFPTIPHMFSQLAKYRLPDDNLNQDIVMMLLVAAAQLEPLYVQLLMDEMAYAEADHAPVDRYGRNDSDRYRRTESR